MSCGEKLEKELKKELDDDRYRHTLGVAYTAACLAMRYGEKTERAFLAGLLHDCAKTKSNDHKKMLSLCEKHEIPISQFERENPALLHAKLGSFFAKEKYEVTDEEILSAIRWHTTGHVGMTLLEKIIYVADYIEPNRKSSRIPNLDEVRSLCFQDLDEGLRRILRDQLLYLNGKKSVDPATQQTYDYYWEGMV
ncbi:MAG: bis(5'-nucleosyl)-tetraphosphatase (symmetrical) YqeK [Clostridium sp.]|nr:bis(5'-nucleosyl)-tetraphosphatase (symmetrical) YqeK [Clostridium sp.]